MQVNLRHKGSITILDIEGNVIGADALALKDIINQQIQMDDSDRRVWGETQHNFKLGTGPDDG